MHSSGSYDAKTPAADVLTFYQSRGYDFVAITDHNRITEPEFPADLVPVFGVELTQNAKVCNPKPAPGYRCLFHTSGIFVDPALAGSDGGLLTIPFRPDRLGAYGAQMDFVSRAGGIAVLNHPLFHFAADARTIRALARRGLRHVELVNASLDDQNPKGRAVAEARAERLWDEVLGSGVLVFAVATDDAHHFADAAERRAEGKYAYVGDRAWVEVRAEKNPGSIRDALAAGRFYASTGVTLTRIERTTERFRVELASGEARTRFVGRGGRVLAQAAGGAAEYVIRGDEGYVRAVVELPSGEKAWLQPVMLP